MNQDQAIGTAKNVGGKLEREFGSVTGDSKLEAEWLARQMAGSAQDLYGQAKEIASDAADGVRTGVATTEDYLRHAIEQRPYVTAFAALCIGWLIGRTRR